MINTKHFYDLLVNEGAGFFTGVPDSLLKDICAYITDNTSPERHIIAANEGNAVGLAAGYHLATGKIPVVYMQNSGLGNAVNPLLSLVDEAVYKIPLLLMIGWRGEPGIKDEPQHIKQGAVTLNLLEAMQIPYLVLSAEQNTADREVKNAFKHIKDTNKAFAIVIRKGTFEPYKIKQKIESDYNLGREEILEILLKHLKNDELIVSTTGKTSREVFELREKLEQGHDRDFLTVGSMGHASQIALGIALAKPARRVVCLDGDAAALMHLGGMAIIGAQAPGNYLHIIINNGAHESVGGQPTVAFNVDFPAIAKANNYKFAASVSTKDALIDTLNSLRDNHYPALIEIKVKTGARKDLGRPTIKPVDNKANFMKNIAGGL